MAKRRFFRKRGRGGKKRDHKKLMRVVKHVSRLEKAGRAYIRTTNNSLTVNSFVAFATTTPMGQASGANFCVDVLTLSPSSIQTNTAGNLQGRLSPFQAVKSIYYRYSFSLQAQVTHASVSPAPLGTSATRSNGCYVRVMIVQYKHNPSQGSLAITGPTVQDLLAPATTATMTGTEILAPQNPLNKDNYAILYDRMHDLNVQGNLEQYGSFSGSFRKKFKVPREVVSFSGTGAAPDLGAGHILVYMFNNMNTTATALGNLYVNTFGFTEMEN